MILLRKLPITAPMMVVGSMIRIRFCGVGRRVGGWVGGWVGKVGLEFGQRKKRRLE